MSVLNENQLLGASGAGGDYEIEQSLRFDDGRESYLSRTPSVAGNRKTWTWSGWVKRGNLGSSTYYCFYGVDGVSPNDRTEFVFTADAFEIYEEVSSTAKISLKTTQLFRDPSAWYHVVIAMDTTQSTNTNRVKFYVNGEQVTSFSASTYPSLNYDTFTNSAKAHVLGARRYADGTTNKFLDGYLAEVNLIDGQALTPDSFGETGDYGEWKPKAYAGTYGTNGFYLPFEQDYTVEGFSTVTYEGNGATQYIGGTGFQPDFTWIKARTDSGKYHQLTDSVRGVTKQLSSNATSAETTDSNRITSFDTDGFSIGNKGDHNASGVDFVAWNWDMGGTTASNTDGSITSSVRANTTYGQSIVSYTGTGSAATIGHGLASAPTMIIVKNRSVVNPWWVYTATLGAGKQLRLNETTAEGSDGGVIWNNTAPTSSVFSVNSNTGSNGSGKSLIAYCFHDVTGYSKFGSYSGNGSATGPVVTLGFTPAFVMVKRTDSADSWLMVDSTRSPNGSTLGHNLKADSSGSEGGGSSTAMTLTSTGFQPIGTDTLTNASGGTYIYAAFADTREYAYWYDQSGNNNDWTSEGGLTESDVMVDSPTNNFATLNPLSGSTGLTLSEGNTELTSSGSSTPWRHKASSFMVSEGKWYYESVFKNSASSMVGITNADSSTAVLDNDVDENVSYRNNGASYNEGTINSGFGATYTAGDIIGIAFDCDSQTVTFYKNNVSQGTESYSIPNIATLTTTSDTGSFVANFGQDSSFAGNKTPQGNQDSNGIGDFYYAPPTGFLALCTNNLPSVDVIPSDNFNTVTWTGDASYPRSFNAGFQTDFLWIKSRSYTGNGIALDTIRGSTKALRTSTTGAETTNTFATFDSEGFNITGTFNESNETTVAWNWKAGGSASSNTNGTITSSVSANPSAGFSIVSYTGTGANATVGHGLSVAPEIVICKNRIDASSWSFNGSAGGLVYGSNKLLLQTTDGLINDANEVTSANSTTFSVGTSGATNGASDAQIAYCFHSVDGYSKVGSYTGNGSADGPFVHCGFRPAYVMVKVTNVTDSWFINDNKRDSYNVVDEQLKANSSDAEATNRGLDFVSNGFKIRDSSTSHNASGNTYIFLAFAENPFKHTNAR